MVADNDPPGADREADVYAVLAILWRQKTFVALMCVLFIGLGVVYCVSTKEWFRAEVLLRPADTKTNQGLSSQIGSLGGLASLAGFAVNKDASAEALAVLTSREFTGKFIEEEKLLPLFFPNEWDDAKKQWRPARFSRVPDIRDGVRYFKKSIQKVQEDRKSGFVTMTIDWTDPNVAARWANLLVERLNEHMRQRALTDSQANVNYLKEELASSNLVALQQAIGRFLENELQKLMLAKATQEYSFKVIDRGQPPKWHSWPRLSIVLPIAFFLGFVVASVIGLAWQLLPSKRRAGSASY